MIFVTIQIVKLIDLGPVQLPFAYMPMEKLQLSLRGPASPVRFVPEHKTAKQLQI